MIKCQPEKRGDKVKVTFAVPKDGMDGHVVAVVGDFNGWDPTATPLRPKGGVRSASVTVPAGRLYAFRYLAEGGRWFNDEDADDYQKNDFGDDNCILDLTPPPEPPTP